ncbi:MAG: hypothetical protein DRO88_11035 [Promethearchaeia archaeon]|nr:MAG: hypothetical protein DRO88_11035 [Candidatus Lokiarchaeia archaeon]
MKFEDELQAFISNIISNKLELESISYLSNNILFVNASGRFYYILYKNNRFALIGNEGDGIDPYWQKKLNVSRVGNQIITFNDKENLSDQLKKDLDIINEIAKSLDLELVCVASETVSENEFSLDFKKLGINALSIYVEKLITREIFEKICSLKKLEVLIIEYSYSVIEKLQSQNEVVILPDCLQNLSDLKVLELYGFRIRDIPNWITKLTKLEEFACSNHLLKNIPPVLFSLKHLTNIFFYPGISRQN